MIRCIANCVAETSAQLIIREQTQSKGAQAKHNPDKSKHSEAHILVYISNTGIQSVVSSNPRSKSCQIYYASQSRDAIGATENPSITF